MRSSLIVGLAATLLACQHGAPADDKPKVFNKKGGVVFLGGSASWDEDEIAGPLVSVSQRSDGSWAGTINQQIIDVNVYPGRASGSFLTMKWTNDQGSMLVAGAFNDRPYRFEVHPDKVFARLPTRAFTLARLPDGTYGRGGELKFEGEASAANPPMPQFGIAMLASFLAAEGLSRDGTGDPTRPTGNPNP